MVVQDETPFRLNVSKYYSAPKHSNVSARFMDVFSISLYIEMTS